MNWQTLIALAREMAATPPSSHLHQTQVRLAVSTSYYAMYHGLTHRNADLLVGASESERALPEWAKTYMALGGDSVNQRLEGDFSDHPEDLRNFAETLAVLHRQRLLAEEDPVVVFTAAEALAWVDGPRQPSPRFCPPTVHSVEPSPCDC